MQHHEVMPVGGNEYLLSLHGSQELYLVSGRSQPEFDRGSDRVARLFKHWNQTE